MKGSAYLFVIGSILIATILLLSALKQSGGTRKKVFHIKSHLFSANLRDACATFLFHQIKTWPFDQRREISLENGDLSLPEGSCSWEIEAQDSRSFQFLVTGVHEKIESKVRLKIRGAENYRGIRWSYTVEEP